MPPITTIGFDADDTLWQNEQFFRLTQERFAALLAGHADPEMLGARLLDAERRNLKLYGFGIKGFVLSMVETAIEVTDGRVPGGVIARILEAGREMLAHPVELLPGTRETLETLKGRYRLILITKGDLFDQERKIAASGLAELFDGVEILSDKSHTSYRRIFDRHGDGPSLAMMIGNSLKSDIVPALEAGAWGTFIPHDLTWEMEHADEPSDHPCYRRVTSIGVIPALLDSLQFD
jgi:putative hydrolase of the HAD superfamily